MPVPVSARAGARQWIALAVLMLPVLLISIDTTALSFAVPQLSAALRPTSVQLLWILDVYPLALAGLLVTFGMLGDRLGRRRLLLVGSAGFAVVSVYAAYAPSAGHLITARALLGVFGATLMPSTLSLLRNLFLADDQRRLAVAIWASGFAGGTALGPIVGGWLLGHFWWGSIFLLGVPTILLLLALGPLVLPESRDPTAARIDSPSVALSIASMVSLVFAVKHGAQAGLDAVTLVASGAAVLAAVLFVRRQLRHPEPLFDVRLFARPAFSASIAANFGSIFVFVGLLLYLSQYLQLVLGLSPMAAGFALVPGALASVVAGLAAVPAARRAPLWLLVPGGLAVTAVGCVLGATLTTATPVYAAVVLFGLLGTGMGFAETLTNDAILSNVPAERAGAASGISETAYELGASVGVALLGSLLAFVYRARLAVPAGVPAEAGDTAAQTLGAAAQAAADLPPGQGAALLASARHAFMLGVEVTSAASAFVAVVAALGVGIALRRGARDPYRSPGT